ncbi:hypothetical protein M3231_24645 [Neobacillus mesonae]|nr:hypothetical protein [Neobacillus mesonae]
MQNLKTEVKRFLEVIVFLVIGFYFTYYVLQYIYESAGIAFMGNVWVNWFGVSYFLFALSTIIAGLLIKKHVVYYSKRLKSKMYWILFAASIYIICIPFVKGVNPF